MTSNQQNIWYKDPLVLFSYDYIAEFFPNKTMTENERLNSLMRFSIYLSVLLYLYNDNEAILMIPIMMGLFTYATHQTHMREQMKNKELVQNGHMQYREPTTDNPFMNPNLVTDKHPDAVAKNVVDPLVQKNIINKYEHSMVQDISDVYQKGNGQRQFYTVPSSTIPNKQGEFANWLYGNMASCKDNQYECLQYEDVRYKSTR